MNKAMLPVAAGVIAAAVGLGIFIVTPILRSAEAALDARAGRLVEASRRTLWDYSADEDRLAAIAQQFKGRGIDLSLDDDQIDTALGVFETEDTDFFADEEQRLRDLTDRSRATRDALEQRYLQSVHGDEWQQHTRNLMAGFSPNANVIREGRQGRDELLKQNRQRLTDALRLVDEALNVNVGDLTGRQLIESNQLKGIILYHQAMTAHRQGQSLRSQAERSALKLVNLALRVQNLQTELNLESDYQVTQRRDQAVETGEAFTRKRQTIDQEIDDLRAIIDDMTDRLARARAAADEARAVMDELLDKGVDLTDPDGFEKFAAQYDAAARRHREAVRESEALQNGTIRNARIDQTGDFLRGEYLPVDGAQIQAERGLDAYQADLAEKEVVRQVVEDQIAAAQADAQTLEEIGKQLRQRQEFAAQQIDQIRTDARGVLAGYNSRQEEARSAEDLAVSLLDQSLRALQSARQAASARTQVDRGGMSPQKWERSPGSMIEGDRWIAANIAFQIADAKIRKALVMYDRYRAADQELALLEQVGEPLGIEPPDTSVLTAEVERAQEAAITLSDEAANMLSTASRPLQEHWTIPAAVAAARYVRVLFGDADALANVRENYQAAVDARSDNPHTKAYERRLNVLKP